METSKLPVNDRISLYNVPCICTNVVAMANNNNNNNNNNNIAIYGVSSRVLTYVDFIFTTTYLMSYS